MTARVSLMFPAWNRKEFTVESFDALISSTDWSLVKDTTIYDVGSVDGTAEWLESAVKRVPGKSVLLRIPKTLIADLMARHISESSGEIIAKIDNDTMVPPGWLSECVGLLDRNPSVALLGIEARFRHIQQVPFESRVCVPAQFVGGIGLWRRSVFSESSPKSSHGPFGWQDWQIQNPSAKSAWIEPCIPVYLLDRMPLEPWTSLSERYVRDGWQRSWPKYPIDSQLWRWRNP